MQLSEYSDEANKTNNQPHLYYHALGLGGESGEALEVIKKSYRPGRTLDSKALEAELGDVLWYLNAVARTAGLTLEGIAERNLEKIRARQAQSPEGKMEGWK